MRVIKLYVQSKARLELWSYLCTHNGGTLSSGGALQAACPPY